VQSPASVVVDQASKLEEHLDLGNQLNRAKKTLKSASKVRMIVQRCLIIVGREDYKIKLLEIL
jgi:hypothetical protein